MELSIFTLLVLSLHMFGKAVESSKSRLEVTDELELFLQRLQQNSLTRKTSTAPTSTAPSSAATESTTPSHSRDENSTPVVSLTTTSKKPGAHQTHQKPKESSEESASVVVNFDMQFLLKKLLEIKLPKLTFRMPMHGVDVLMGGIETESSEEFTSTTTDDGGGDTTPNPTEKPDCQDNECLKSCDIGISLIYDENECVVGCECKPWKCENFKCDSDSACPRGQFFQSNDMGCHESCTCVTPSLDCLEITCRKDCPFGYTLMRDSMGCLLHSCICNICPTLTCSPCEEGKRYEMDSKGCQKSCTCVDDPCDGPEQLACEARTCKHNAILLEDQNGCFDEDCSCHFASNILDNYSAGQGYIGSCPSCGKRELKEDARPGDRKIYAVRNGVGLKNLDKVHERREETDEELERRLIAALISTLNGA